MIDYPTPISNTVIDSLWILFHDQTQPLYVRCYAARILVREEKISAIELFKNILLDFI